MTKIFFTILIFFLIPFSVFASGLDQKLSGRILLDVERNGEAWYIYPENNKRYYLGRPADAFCVMRELGLGISELNFQRIAQAGMEIDGDLELTKRLAGKIILQTEKNGEAWYINPVDLKKYYLGRPEDAFQIMRKLGLGITMENLAKVHKPDYNESINQYSKYEHKSIFVTDKEFVVDLIEINLDNPNLEIFTDTADTASCESGCHAKTLGEYVFAHNGFTGINGSYFCTSSSCEGLNYYYFPVYNSDLDEMINGEKLKYWTTGPIMAWDENNNFYYFKDSRDFPVKGWSASSGKSVSQAFEENYGTKLQAAIGNKPRLIENKMNLLIEWEVDDKQRNVKALRGAIAYKSSLESSGKGKIYLVIAQNATVPDLANIMKEMEVDYALNLDGGYSSALIYNGEYMMGPGRNIPNAIIFSE